MPKAKGVGLGGYHRKIITIPFVRLKEDLDQCLFENLFTFAKFIF